MTGELARLVYARPSGRDDDGVASEASKSDAGFRWRSVVFDPAALAVNPMLLDVRKRAQQRVRQRPAVARLRAERSEVPKTQGRQAETMTA